MSPQHPGWALSDSADVQLYKYLKSIDWQYSSLLLSDPHDVDLAARAVAIGGIACHPFANFYVFGARPEESMVRYVNQVKGRPPDQTGSVVTTPERVGALFDWSKLPQRMGEDQVLGLVEGLLELGPFGFRGPARAGLPSILTADDKGIRTVQVVSSGYACPSNVLYARMMDAVGQPYLYGTSGNQSRLLTGAEDEPVHHYLAPLQRLFGDVEGFFMVGVEDEAAMHARYPLHAPMSATLLSFHKDGPDSPLPTVVVERYGSLEIDHVRRVAAQVGLAVALAPAAFRRLTAHQYETESQRAP